jgi:hypothetical protein
VMMARPMRRPCAGGAPPDETAHAGRHARPVASWADVGGYRLRHGPTWK